MSASAARCRTASGRAPLQQPLDGAGLGEIHGQVARPLRMARSPDDLQPAGDQLGRRLAAEEAGAASDEDAHAAPSLRAPRRE